MSRIWSWQRDAGGLALALFLLSQGVSRATHAQTGKSTTFGLTMQGAAVESGSAVARDALGRPCLDVEAAARAHVVNPELIDHIVSLKNNCPRLIKVKICYAETDQCTDAAVSSYGRSDVILGTMIGVKTFRYSISQKQS